MHGAVLNVKLSTENLILVNKNFSYLDLRMGRLNVSIYGHVLYKIAWRHCIDFGGGCAMVSMKIVDSKRIPVI